MHHRHLLPNEIDLLVDEETGFGMQPLREHVRDCADCRARLTEAQQLVGSLEAIPLFSPRVGMAERVMTQVPVFVPWHVTARDAIAQWTPTSTGARAAVAVLMAVMGSLVTGLTLWIATRGDLVAMFTGLIGERASNTVSDAVGSVVVGLFGPQVVVAVQQVGPLGIAFAAGGFLVASLATVLGLRLIAASSRARS